MHLLFLTHYFPPEIGTAPHLSAELAETLVHNGHQVTVVTNFPRYNLHPLPEGYRRRLLKREEKGGVEILRINGPNFYSSSRFSRKMVQLLAPPVLGWRARWVRKPDVIFTVTPPILMGISALRLARRYRVPCVVNVQDLFPQAMIDLGVIRSQWLIRLFEAWERAVYHGAAAITVMSDGNREFVINKGTDPAKVHTVFNWVDTETIQPMTRANEFRQELNLDASQFVVMSAGTMGASQGLEVLIDAAKILQAEPDIVFLMVGDGTEQQRLVQKAAGALNVRFVPMQPKERYPAVLAAADVCVATLLPEVRTPAVPSKIATIMAAGRPVVAAFPPGDAPNLIQNANAGITVDAGDAAALAAAILRLKNHPELAHTFSVAGRRFAESHLSRPACVARLQAILQGVIDAAGR